MSSSNSTPQGPDLERDGIAEHELKEGEPVLGRVGDDAVILVRRAEEAFAVGATCTHYGGPLAEGIVEGDTIRCPWHHACFDLRTGEASGPPALSPLPCFGVVRRDGRLFVSSEKLVRKKPSVDATANIVVLGGGAAGFSACEMLRRRGFAGRITVISADDSAPYDRPNASKDYLAGTAPEEWMPLRPPEYYQEQNIELLLNSEATAIDTSAKQIRLRNGNTISYEKLLISTGAHPAPLSIPGADLPHVHMLRTLSDSRAIIARAETAKRAVVIGASFIGLEVSAALRTRGVEVHVVAPDKEPLARILGEQIGRVIRRIHQEHGVIFHLGNKPTSIDAQTVTLDGGEQVTADLVVIGVGVRPSTELAERAGLTVDRGILVDKTLRTSDANIWAAGDVARYPDPRGASADATLRIEHWVVAQRQGQVAALNMLATATGGDAVNFNAVPFFWSSHYDATLAYVGHAGAWDSIDIDGELESRDFAAAFRRAGRTLAVATMGRDKTSLYAETALERDDESALRSLIPTS